MTVITVADEKYFEYLRVFCRSAAVNLAGVTIECCLVNCGKNHEEILCKDNPHVIVKHTKYDGESLTVFCTNARTWLLLSARKVYSGAIFWLDATTIIMKPCGSLSELMTDTDILIHRKAGEQGGYLTGTLGLSDNPLISELLKEWDTELQKESDNWYINQIVIAQLIEKYKDKLKIKQLPSEYIDWKFKDSFIWTGKGRKARCDKRWVKEMKKWGVEWSNPGSAPETRYVKEKKPQIDYIKQNVKKEIKYWVKKGDRVAGRGERLEGLFNKYVPNGDYNIVADVGCGPREGIFERKRFPVMYAVDPLWKEYQKADVDVVNENVIRIRDSAQDFVLPQKADLIVSFNSLDHSGYIYKSVYNIWENLKIGGLFFLHLHLRTKKEFDEIHQMELTESIMQKVLSHFQILRQDVFDRDFLYDADKVTPRMFVGLMKKL